MSTFNPYAEALAMIEQHPGTGGAASMAKLVLSLYNSQCGFAFAECVGNLDAANTTLALKLVRHYTDHGETDALREVGKQLVDKHYPRLWEYSLAMRDAREATRAKWEADERKAELDALDAAEAALFTDPTKLIPANKAKELLEQNDPLVLYAFYNVAGDWRDSKLSRETVHAAIDLAGGAELSYNCPESSQTLAVRVDQRIYYVCSDYDAREAYLETIQPPRKPIPRTVSVPPRS